MESPAEFSSTPDHQSTPDAQFAAAFQARDAALVAHENARLVTVTNVQGPVLVGPAGPVSSGAGVIVSWTTSSL